MFENAATTEQKEKEAETIKALARAFEMLLKMNLKANPQLYRKRIGIFRLNVKNLFILVNLFFAGNFLYRNESFYCIAICLLDFLLLSRKKIRKISADLSKRKLSVDFFK